MPLRITNPGQQAAVLNRWADGIEQQLAHLKNKTPVLPKPVAFKTNNQNNTLQSELNLIAGQNIVLTRLPFGQVEISAISSTDGLTHAETPHYTDPSFIGLRDEFVGFNNAIFGELGWVVQGSSVISDFQNFSAFPSSTFGVLEIYPSASTANAGPSLTLEEHAAAAVITGGQGNTMWPLLDYPGWKLTWIFGNKVPNAFFRPGIDAWNTSHKSFYIGLGYASGSNPTIFQTRPPVFIGCRYDSDAGIGDTTTYHLEATFNNVQNSSTRNNTKGTNGGDVDSGITVTEGKFHRLEISCQVLGQVTVTLDTFSTTFTIPQKSDTWVGTITVSRGQGVEEYSGNSAATNLFAGAPGTKVTWSGFPSTPTNLTGYNGTIVAGYTQSTGTVDAFDSGQTTNGTASNITTLYYPALQPFCCNINDSAGGVAGSAFAAAIDFFGFIWNPALRTSGGTPNPSLPRYF